MQLTLQFLFDLAEMKSNYDENYLIVALSAWNIRKDPVNP